MTTAEDTAATVPCGMQFCPASAPVHMARAWFCARHRFPGGQGDPSVTVIINGMDSTFVNGVDYVVAFHEGRHARGRFRGQFDLVTSGNGRLRFDHEDGSTWVEVDPDLVDDIVAV